MDPEGFRDRGQRYGCLVARENARRVVEDPSVLEAGRRHRERFSRDEPHRRHGYALWTTPLDAGPEAVVEAADRAERAGRPCPRDGAILRRVVGAGAGAAAARGALAPADPWRRRMSAKARDLVKAAIAPLLRAAAGVSGRETVVIVGREPSSRD